MGMSSRELRELYYMEREADAQDTDIKRLWKRTPSFPQVYPGIPHGIPMFPSTSRTSNTTDTGTTLTATSNTTDTNTTATFTTDTFTTFTADCPDEANPCIVEQSYQVEFYLSQVAYGYCGRTGFYPTGVSYNCASTLLTLMQTSKNKSTVVAYGCTYDKYIFHYGVPWPITVGSVTIDSPSNITLTLTLFDFISGGECTCPESVFGLGSTYYTDLEMYAASSVLPYLTCRIAIPSQTYPGCMERGGLLYGQITGPSGSCYSCLTETDPCTGLPFPDGFNRQVWITVKARIL